MLLDYTRGHWDGLEGLVGKIDKDWRLTEEGM